MCIQLTHACALREQVDRFLAETVRRNAELVEATATLQGQVDALRRSAASKKVAAKRSAARKAAKQVAAANKSAAAPAVKKGGAGATAPAAAGAKAGGTSGSSAGGCARPAAAEVLGYPGEWMENFERDQMGFASGYEGAFTIHSGSGSDHG